MPGFQEILVLLIIISAIFFLPRIIGSTKKTEQKKTINISPQIRIMVVFSILWPFILSFFLKPWNNNVTEYLIYAFFPVLLIWSLIWIIDGFKKRK